MNTRAKIMGLAALPLAGLLATGGVAMGQSAGTSSGTRAVQQAIIQKAGDPRPEHAVKTAAQPAHQHQARDHDRTNCGDRQQAQTGTRTMEHARDGSCDHHADR